MYLAIYINRSEEPIFSTTLYAYGGKASIYDLRSIIESYMEEKSLVHAACSFRVQVDRNDFTSGEFTLIHCKPQIQNADCKQFLQSHFLTPHAVRLVPHDFQIDLQYFVFPDEIGQCSTLFVIQPEGESQPISLSVSALPIASKQFDLCFEDLNEDDLLAQLPQGTKGKLLSVTLYRGARTFTLFFTDEPPTLTLYYYNASMFTTHSILPLRPSANFPLIAAPPFVVGRVPLTMTTRRLSMRAKLPLSHTCKPST